MTRDEWLRTISPHLFEPCERCGIEARNHFDVPTCDGFYVSPMKVDAMQHGSSDDLFRHLRSVE